MSRGPCTFRKPDVVRLLKAAKAAGCPVDRIEIFDRFGNKIVAVTGTGGHTVRVDCTEEGGRNPWDEVLIDAQDKNRTS
jgi:hypothetical protein